MRLDTYLLSSIDVILGADTSILIVSIFLAGHTFSARSVLVLVAITAAAKGRLPSKRRGDYVVASLIVTDLDDHRSLLRSWPLPPRLRRLANRVLLRT